MPGRIVVDDRARMVNEQNAMVGKGVREENPFFTGERGNSLFTHTRSREQEKREGNTMKSTRLILAFTLVLLFLTSDVFAWSYKEAAEPYRGQTVRLIGDSYAPWFAYKELKAEFEEMTGIKVVMEDTDFVTQIEKFTSDMVARTKVYDGTFMAHFRLGEYAERDWLVEIEELLAMPGVQDPTFHVTKDIPPAILNNACSYKGKIYGPPYAFVAPFYCYRKDLAGHPAVSYTHLTLPTN